MLLLAGLLGAMLFYRLGALPLIDPDEPRYAQSAREMIERGEAFVPYFNGVPRINKPVLFYWLICISYKLGGISEFSARLPSALAALGLLLATFFFVARLQGFSAAALSCLILGCLPLFFVSARLVMPDMTLSLWITLSLFCFYHGWQAKLPRAKRNWYIAFYLFQVAGAWTKGPVGILIPMAVAVLSILRARDRQELGALKLQRALPLVLAASLCWFVYVLLFVDRQQMETLAYHETISRFLALSGESHDPVYYYLRILAVGLFPMLVLGPWAVYHRLKTAPPGRLLIFLETWMLFVLFFFSACFAKKPQYIIPLACPFAVWMAVVCAQAVSQKKYADRLLPGLLVLLLVGLSIVVCRGMGWIAHEVPAIMPYGIAAGMLALTALLLALLFAVRCWYMASLVSVSILMAPLALAFLQGGIAWFGSERSLKEYIHQNQAILDQVETIHYYPINFNSLVFYAHRPVERIGNLSAVVARIKGQEPIVCLMRESDFEKKRAELAPFLAAAQGNKIIVSNVKSPPAPANP